jgi:lipoprotein-anchoring transpeptidase ErfK/SrfK
MDNKDPISRRIFIKKSMLAASSAALTPYFFNKNAVLDNWPDSRYLMRNNVYLPYTLKIRSRPQLEATVIRDLKEDECLPWLQEVVGENAVWTPNRRWVQTPEGFVYAPSVQKVRNLPNTPIDALPLSGEEPGFWAEVTVPFINLELANPPIRSPLFQHTAPGLWRLYYGQVIWVDAIDTSSEVTKYRLNERYGSYGDVFLAEAVAFRHISEEEVAPINPDVGDKKIVINIDQQILSCYEGNNEVYFCLISSGKKKDLNWVPVETWRTPPGTHWINRKLISLHMSANDGQGTGWDLFGIGWTCFFASGGVAIHSTFWHNDFGNPKSHGCVNATPEDAKWIFRWTTPGVIYGEGEKTDTTYPYKGTVVQVIDSEDF